MPIYGVTWQGQTHTFPACWEIQFLLHLHHNHRWSRMDLEEFIWYWGRVKHDVNVTSDASQFACLGRRNFKTAFLRCWGLLHVPHKCLNSCRFLYPGFIWYAVKNSKRNETMRQWASERGTGKFILQIEIGNKKKSGRKGMVVTLFCVTLSKPFS